MLGEYRFGRAMCFPQRMMRGASGSSSRKRVSAGEPASRTSSAPAAASARAWFVELGRVVLRPGRGQADVAVGVDEPGNHPAAGGDGLGSRHRLEGEAPVDDPEVSFLRVGQDDAANV